MKRFYLALAMLAALPAAASAQTILNEGFETTSTDQYSPNFPDGWSTVDSYTGNNDRYRWNVYYYEKGTMTKSPPLHDRESCHPHIAQRQQMRQT